MDPLVIALIVVAVLLLGGWGYGYYAPRPVLVEGDPIAAPGWASPIGILGLVVIVFVLAMLLTGWRPFIVAW